MGNSAGKSSEKKKKESNQEAESRVTSKDEPLDDSKLNVVADAEIVSQPCCEKGTPHGPVDTGTVDEEIGENFSKMTLKTEPEQESNTGHVRIEDPSFAMVALYCRSFGRQHYHLVGFPTPVLFNDAWKSHRYHKEHNKKEFPCALLLSFGLANFVSYTAHFCKHEAQNKAEIVSIGSGNGAVEGEIISAYRKHFGEEINITLVDPNPKYKVDLKTAEDLMKARPEVVGNCVLLIIKPDSPLENDECDIDAVRKLEPLAALVVYDRTGVSAREEVTAFSSYRTKEPDGCGLSDRELSALGLENYAVEKVTGLDVYLDEIPAVQGPIPLHCLRMLKLKKK